MNKSAIQKYAIWARNELIEQVKQRAFQYGISETGFGDENASIVAGRVLSSDEKRQRKQFIEVIKRSTYQQTIEEVAYTWFNRFIALRYMEVNDYLPTHVRVFSDASGNFKPEILSNVLHIDLPGLDKDKVSEFLNSNQTQELYRYLLLTQCNALNELLPEMFERLGAYTEMLLPNNILKPEGVIGRLVNDIPEENFKDAVQIIGWMYQYYNSDVKDQVINIYKGVIKKEDIPAATQLFTTDWVVRYMVDNSLGKYWLERNPNSTLKRKLDFYMPYDSVYINEKINPTELKVFDPCMGSGHILVYAFDVLIEIYTECGYTPRDAAKIIVEKNLYGLDIDNRAYQLAYFAVMMKARQYNRRILNEPLENNLASIVESDSIEGFDEYSKQLDFDNIMIESTNEIINFYRNAKEFGSLLNVDAINFDVTLIERLQNYDQKSTNNLFVNSFREKNTDIIQKLIKQTKILGEKYQVVVTNPPYLNKMDAKLKGFVQNHFKDYSTDLFSVFMYRNFKFCTSDGYSAFMTPFVWMFIKSYEKLREHIIATKNIASLIQMEYSAFEEATVPICTFILCNKKDNSNGVYIKLSDFKGGMNIQKEKVLKVLENNQLGYLYKANANNFSKVPGSPIAYWVSNKLLQAFEEGKPLVSVADPKQGLATADNNRFLRLWYEVSRIKIGFSYTRDEAKSSNLKWFPYNKGGEYRKWYGNNDYVINWENDGTELRAFSGSVIRNPNYQMCESISWSKISSGNIAFRYKPTGHLFDVAGTSVFANKEMIQYIHGFCNSFVALAIANVLSPTLNYEVGHIASFPIIERRSEEVKSIVSQNIYLSHADWDSFETSWDFKQHPLFSGERTVESAFGKWEREAKERFQTLKAKEEELNRIFIDIYGLQDELIPEVEDKDVTVRRADLGREIHSLISYAVGCMFGRYSLDKEGLVYAGGEWDASKYHMFPVDKDNIIPILDDEYFEDDIVGRLVTFIKTVYGEETLEENLKFIADALGGKGTSREIIRNYFLNDFYTDHLKIYQKRPIYWMFDSGKKNGFKALIYMHRYSRDLLAKLRTDYVHEQQERYRTQLSRISTELNHALGSERSKLLKQQDKLTEQLKEITIFEEKVHHLADQHIDIDLDDGVKKNYELFVDVLAKI